ncbi:MAG TPA: AraC family transcriptional regulator ligand-binding domain-containing protein [Polyangiales bacterium]|nr:AraC family transcriptional regulator ligand-binding domain-containing protein [Polyangiales bacterium]
MQPATHPWLPTIAASNARRVLRFGTSRGVSPASIGAGAESETRPNARVPAGRMFEIWQQLGAALDCALPIQVAQRSSLEDLQLLGFVVSTAPTLREALEAFVRYGALLSDAFVWSLSYEPRSVEVRWHCRVPIESGVRISLETSVAQVVQGVRQLLGSELDPLRVEFAHPAPADTAAHRGFFRCRVDWNGARYRVVFPNHVLDAAPRQANRALFQYLCSQAELQISELAPQPLAARVRAELARELLDGHVVRLSEVAQRLGMSERSLRRQLAAESISFRHLLDSERRERARTLLAQPGASVTRVALELGFADASALAHASRRWFARAPGDLALR